jgi:predicted nucleic acid-binding Zn ribbon protein
MATYVYETLSKPVRRFEIRQSMKDDALRVHPESGEPIRRVITGGFGYVGKSRGGTAPATGHSCGSGGCGCH